MAMMGDRVAAEEAFYRSLTVSRRVCAKLLELRASTGSHASGATRENTLRPATCLRRSTAGSPRALTRSI